MISNKSLKSSLGSLLFVAALQLVLGFSFTPHCQASDSDEFHMAVGGGGVFGKKGVDSNSASLHGAPELVVFGYKPLAKGFWLRPGGRASFAWEQSGMPQALKISEYDTKLSAEMGVFYDWTIMPSFTLGAGMMYRRTSLQVNAPITVQDDRISGGSVHPFIQAQLGVGVPIEKGKIVVEPFVRKIHVFNDSRLNWSAGAEVTVSLF